MKLAILDRDGLLNALGDDSSPRRTTGCQCRARWSHCARRTTRAGMWWWPPTSPAGPGLAGRGGPQRHPRKMHRQMAAVGGRIDAVFYCPHRRRDTAAASPPRACWSRFASAMAWSRTMCWWWATARRTCKRGPPWGQVAPGVLSHAAGLQPGRRRCRGLACGHSGACQPGAMGERATVARNAAVACSGTVGGGLIL